MERRAFLRSVERVAVGALCACMPVAGCSGLRYVPSALDGGRLIIRRADVGTDRYVLVEHPQISRAIYLHRHPDDSYSAVLTRCTHRGCQVEPAGDRLECPCHGSQYRFTGEVLRGPAQRSLSRYDVTSDSEHLFIHVSDQL